MSVTSWFLYDFMRQWCLLTFYMFCCSYLIVKDDKTLESYGLNAGTFFFDDMFSSRCLSYL